MERAELMRGVCNRERVVNKSLVELKTLKWRLERFSAIRFHSGGANEWSDIKIYAGNRWAWIALRCFEPITKIIKLALTAGARRTVNSVLILLFSVRIKIPEFRSLLFSSTRFNISYFIFWLFTYQINVRLQKLFHTLMFIQITNGEKYYE